MLHDFIMKYAFVIYDQQNCIEYYLTQILQLISTQRFNEIEQIHSEM